MLAAKCGAVAGPIKKSAISYCNVGLGLFAARIFGTGETVGLYYGRLVYGSLVEEKQKWKGDGK